MANSPQGAESSCAALSDHCAWAAWRTVHLVGFNDVMRHLRSECGWRCSPQLHSWRRSAFTNGVGRARPRGFRWRRRGTLPLSYGKIRAVKVRPSQANLVPPSTPSSARSSPVLVPEGEEVPGSHARWLSARCPTLVSLDSASRAAGVSCIHRMQFGRSVAVCSGDRALHPGVDT